MKQSTNSATYIDLMKAKWDNRVKDYIRQYGPNVLQDREFMKAARDTYESILKTRPFKELSFDEKIDYRIMRGQRRQLNRELYPSWFLRNARGLIVASFRLAGTILKTLGRLLNNLLAVLTGTPGLQFSRTPRRQPNRSLIRPLSQQRQATPGPAVQQRNATQPQAVEKVVPLRRNSSRVVNMNNQTQGQHI